MADDIIGHALMFGPGIVFIGLVLWHTPLYIWKERLALVRELLTRRRRG